MVASASDAGFDCTVETFERVSADDGLRFRETGFWSGPILRFFRCCCSILGSVVVPPLNIVQGTSGTGQRERGSELASASNVECVSGKREFATRDKGAERVELIMRMIELSARRHCQQSAEGDGKKGRWVHQHANGPSSWRRDARHFGSTQPRLLMRNCGIGFNLAQISCPTPNITRLTSHWI